MPAPVAVSVDRQGRVVIPQQERERLGVRDGGRLELTATPEGLLLERRHRGVVTTADDGLPVVTIDELQSVSNDEVVDAIHRQRDGE